MVLLSGGPSREQNHLLATHVALTGRPTPDSRGGNDADKVESRTDFPNYAAALDLIRPRQDGIPTGVLLPNYYIEGPLTWPGQHAGFLGAKHGRMPGKSIPVVAIAGLLVSVMFVSFAFAQLTVTSVQPRSCKAGETSRITFTGKGFDLPLRVITSCSNATTTIESTAPEQAVIALTTSVQTPLGPIAIWLATSAGPAEPVIVVVDDLKPCLNKVTTIRQQRRSRSKL